MNTISLHATEGNPYTIYALRDPYDLRARYIGMTRDPEKRLKQHLACDGSNPEKDSWIRERHKMDNGDNRNRL